MAGEGPDQVDDLEARMAALERRLAALESGRAAPVEAAVVRSNAVPYATPAALQPTSPLVTQPTSMPPPQPPIWPGQTQGLPQAAPASAAPPRRPPLSLGQLEEQLSGRLLGWVGGAALVIGAVFFLSLAFSRGWVGPEARVLIGLVAAAIALVGGAFLYERRFGTPALVLVAVGVSVGMLALYAATREYGFLPAELALVGSFVIAVGAAAIALRTDSAVVAALGLAAVLAGPPVFEAPPNLVTVLFLGAALVGSTLIALNRAWPWLPSVGFVLTAWQVEIWLGGETSVQLAMVVVVAYWLTNAIAAMGESLLWNRDRLHLSSALLLVANATFAIAAISLVLDEATPLIRSIALLGLAAGHAVLAAPPLIRTRGSSQVGLLAAGTGMAVLGVWAGRELGAVVRPVVWIGLGTAAGFVGIVGRRLDALAVAGAFGLGALGHFVLVEAPFRTFAVAIDPPHDRIPFVSPAGAVLGAALLSAIVLTGLAWRELRRRPVPGAVTLTADLALAVGILSGAALVAYTAPFELDVRGAVLVWAALASGAFAALTIARKDPDAALALVAGGGTLVGMALAVTLDLVAPPDRMVVDPFGSASVTPFLNDASLLLGALAAAMLVLAHVAGRASVWRAPAVLVAAALVVYLGSLALVDAFQARTPTATAPEEVATQAQVALSIAWVLVGAVAFAIGLVRSIQTARYAGLALLTLATVKVFLFDLAALDVAYRVLSFIGLGLVLLASSFVSVRVRARAADAGAPGGG
jgi:uncharacterized membrane protein